MPNSLKASLNQLLIGLFILLSTTTTTLAQLKIRNNEVISYARFLRKVSKEQIHQLDTGVLLVRLITKKHSIAALRSIGKDNKANKIEAKQEKLNRQIVRGFQSNFNFCPTYYFFSAYSKYVRAGQLDSVVFLNADLEPDPTIKVDSNATIFTTEFGKTAQDPTPFFDYYYFTQEKNGLQKETAVWGGPNLGLSALVIMNDQFIQLRRPFPYYARFSIIFQQNKPKNSVKIMNRKLHNYLRKTSS